MSFHWVIFFGYFQIAVAFLCLYRILHDNLSFFSNYQKVALALTGVFVSCGMHYLFQLFDPVYEVLWGWIIQVPLTIVLVYYFNPWQVKESELKIKEFLEPVEALKQSDDLLNLIKRGSKVIMLGELSEDNKELRIIWYSQGFLEWVETFTTIPSEGLIGIDWYRFAQIPLSWQSQYEEVFKLQVTRREKRKEWKTKNKIVDWCVVPDDRKFYSSFGDLTEFYDEIESLAQINQKFIEEKLGGL